MSTAVATQEPKSVSARVIAAVEHTGQFDQLLPAPYRSMAQRMLQRARLYIANSPNRDKIQACTIPSLVTAILEAGAMGLVLDGKMAHIVPFNCKVKDESGKDRWESRATFMPEYKGIINVARRHGTIVDGFAHHVHRNDIFKRALVNGKWLVEYEPQLEDRGDYMGTFATLIFDGGRFVCEYMTEEEIQLVRNRSKSKDNGPWVTDFGEMAKKTVLKRAIKTYADDPEVLDLLDQDNAVCGLVEAEATSSEPLPKLHGARKGAPLRLGQSESPPEDMLQDLPEVRDEPRREHEGSKSPPTPDSYFAACSSLRECEDRLNELFAENVDASEDDLRRACESRKDTIKGRK